MQEANENPFQAQGTKKRYVMTNELIGKFKSKEDFIRYFKEACK